MNPFTPPPFTPPPPTTPATMKHSGFGLASFFMSLGVGLLLLLVFVIAGYLEVSTPGGMDENAPSTALIGLGAILLCGLDLVALGLGIAGLVQKGRKKIFAALGTGFSAFTLLGTVALMVLGTLAQ